MIKDIFGYAFKDNSIVPPDPGTPAGVSRQFANLTTANGVVIATIPITPIANPQQGLFAFAVKIVSFTGVLIPCKISLSIETSGLRFGVNLSLQNTTLDGETYTQIATGSTHVVCIGEQYGYSLLYADTAFNPFTVLPGKWIWVEGNIVRDNPELSVLRIQGKPYHPTHHMAIDTTPGGWAITENRGVLEIQSLSDIPLTIDIAHMYGTVFSTATGTDGMELTEPLANYTTADLITTSTNEPWLINWNSTDNPLGNVGTITSDWTCSTPIALIEEAPTLNKRAPDTHDILWARFPISLYSRETIDGTDKVLDYYYHGNLIYEIDQVPEGEESAFIVSVSSFANATLDYRNTLNYQSSEINSRDQKYNIKSCIYLKYFDRGGSAVFKNITSSTNNVVGLTYFNAQTLVNNNRVNQQTVTMGSTTLDNIYSKAKRLFMITHRESKTPIGSSVSLRYFAVYRQPVIDANPGIPWADASLMEAYFYKTGTKNVIDDLSNAVPGVVPEIYVDTHNYRGWGVNKSSSLYNYYCTTEYELSLARCVDYKYNERVISSPPTILGLSHYLTVPYNHHTTIETVPGDFIAGGAV